MKGYVLTYRVGRATVTEPYACSECVADGAAYCGCFSAARLRASEVMRPHEIHRNGRLLGYCKSVFRSGVESAP